MNALEYYDTYRSRSRFLGAGDEPGDGSFLYCDPDQVVLGSADGVHTILIDRTAGTSIAGPLSIGARPGQIRVGGLWKIHDQVVTGLPSTVFTPVPWLRADLPSFSRAMYEGIARVGRLLGGF